MRTLITIGACYLDTILTVSHYPAEDEKLRATTLSRRRGGNTLNTLEVLQQLLLTPYHQHLAAKHGRPAPINIYPIAVLPARWSPATQEIEASLQPQSQSSLVKPNVAVSVNLKHCIYREECSEPAASYIIKSVEAGTRTIVNYNGLREMGFWDFVCAVDRLGTDREGKGKGDGDGDGDGDEDGGRWFHFEGRIPDVTLQCIHYLRHDHPEDKISVEIEKPGREGLQELAAEADVVFYSKSWAVGNGYKSAMECLEAQSPLTPKATLLCCTWGEEGAACMDKKQETSVNSSTYKVEQGQVVDTIGAGDTFIAGILYALIYREKPAGGFDVSDLVDFANRIAGRKVEREGFEGLGRAMWGDMDILPV
ncbi:hypothetical protein FQN50_003612 [Emmonsiellopsis sp. PD_5]|nr:hypothetical protein FQN50_003612 [Emmonsiellopsis sp. PD_5]